MPSVAVLKRGIAANGGQVDIMHFYQNPDGGPVATQSGPMRIIRQLKLPMRQQPCGFLSDSAGGASRKYPNHRKDARLTDVGVNSPNATGDEIAPLGSTIDC